MNFCQVFTIFLTILNNSHYKWYSPLSKKSGIPSKHGRIKPPPPAGFKIQRVFLIFTDIEKLRIFQTIIILDLNAFLTCTAEHRWGKEVMQKSVDL
jgi:hypothetical protein